MLLSFEARREVASGGRWCHTGGDGRWLVGGCMLFRLSMKRLAVGEGRLSLACD